MITFALIGSGWRAEFYLRIAHLLPLQFRCEGIVVRDPGKRAEVELRWGISAFDSIDKLAEKVECDFVITSVSRPAHPDVLRQLACVKIPVLAETPPADDLEALKTVWHELGGKGLKIQVAEQYHLAPVHRAWLKFLSKGKLGEISHAQVSIAHGYHGISLLRKYLSIGFENINLSARSFSSPIVEGPGRNGVPAYERKIESHQIIAHFECNGKLGVYDFTPSQYFGWIRRPRLCIRGGRGEIVNDACTYLQDYTTPVSVRLIRHESGGALHLTEKHLRGIQIGEEWYYTTPFGPAPLSDDEIAVATCMVCMKEYLATGREFYSLREACHDQYLNLLMLQSIKTKKPIRSENLWA
ncbi:MAG: gfo/Idh/MocA family oxidoreductase [Chitinivibrionales bacterium]|nr:gfo/Idh/MocA family oxidoreductase [Chitinivibrionales bacterium]